MRSTSHQTTADDHVETTEEAKTIRPEPLVPERLSVAYDNGLSVRAELAAAFRRRGRGVSARFTHQRATDFYRSSGHAWTRKLTRRVG